MNRNPYENLPMKPSAPREGQSDLGSFDKPIDKPCTCGGEIFPTGTGDYRCHNCGKHYSAEELGLAPKE